LRTERDASEPHRLVCGECGVESPPDAAGWRAYLGTEHEVGTEDEAFAFCPECSEREFG
jgi:ribosomal protein S27AE